MSIIPIPQGHPKNSSLLSIFLIWIHLVEFFPSPLIRIQIYTSPSHYNSSILLFLPFFSSQFVFYKFSVCPHTATKMPFMYSFSGNCALRSLSLNIHIHVSVSDLCISRIGPYISFSRIGRSIVGIYKSLTDT